MSLDLFVTDEYRPDRFFGLQTVLQTPTCTSDSKTPVFKPSNSQRGSKGPRFGNEE
jgi:hypothetical protein